LTTKEYKLTEIAYVQRAKRNQLYPKGTCYIQVSATHGQINILTSDNYIETKNAVILPKIEVVPEYFKIALERSVPKFLANYQSTIADFSFFEIELHEDIMAQMQIVELMRKFDDVIMTEEKTIDVLEKIKKIGQSKLLL
jgi:hypothetical protein